MPHRSGASHALAALVTVIIGGLLSDLVADLAAGANVTDAVLTVVASPPGPFDSALVPALTQLVAILLLAFVWGYAYHVRTFGREDDDWRRR